MKRTRPHSQRGAALIMVVATIAIITAVSVDLAYNTRVSLHTAANARDELRAYYLAKSAVNMSRLVIHFQHQLDQASGSIGPMISGLLGSGGGDLTKMLGSAGLPPEMASMLSQASSGMNVRLWEVVPIDSNATSMFLSSSGEPEPGAPDDHAPPPGAQPERRNTTDADFLPSDVPNVRGFGGFDGSFKAKIEDEERKINVTQLAGLGAQPVAQLARFMQMVKDPKYDFLFDEEDANGIRASREDTVIAMRDWVDEDETSSALTQDPMNPFGQGFTDENYVYDRMQPPYKAKNAKFDSLDELYFVNGVSDAFMAAFGDKLTVYPDINATINVNTNDPTQMLVNISVMADPRIPQPILLDPTLVPRVMQAVQLAKPLPFLSISVQTFAQVLTALGVQVLAQYTQPNSPQSAFGDKSQTFHIHAIGNVGDVVKTIDCVVTTDGRAGPLADDLGRVIHWHEG